MYRTLLLASLASLALARPQLSDLPDASEVELIPPVSTNQDAEVGEGGGGPIVILVRGRRPSLSDLFPGSSSEGGIDSILRNAFGSSFGGSPFDSSFGSSFDSSFGGSPFDSSFGGSSGSSDFNPFRNSGFNPFMPRIPDFFGNPDNSGSDNETTSGTGFPDLDEILGLGEDEDEEDNVEIDEDGACGPLCTIFNLMRGIHTAIKPQLNGTIFDDEYDTNNSTYEEKVLEDGTVVRINRTVIADKDGFGNTFYFKSSVSHVIDTEDSESDAETIDVDIDNAEEEMEEDMEADMEADYAGEVEVVEEDDPSLNEIDDGLLDE